MARRRMADERKLRTREHIIADLGINHVERHILRCGNSVNRIEKDYGIDLLMNTYNENGEVENGNVQFQVKATDSLMLLKDSRTIAVRLELAHIRWWQREYMPVILVVYDGKKDKAYWLYIQQYLKEARVDFGKLSKSQQRLTVHIPTQNRLNSNAVKEFREYQQRIVERIWRLYHGE